MLGYDVCFNYDVDYLGSKKFLMVWRYSIAVKELSFINKLFFFYIYIVLLYFMCITVLIS